jgi:alanyl aminopeptidase
LEVASNVPSAQESRTGDLKTVAFGRTPPMPSYLVAFAVGPLEFVPVPGLPVPGRIVTPRGQSTLAVDAARLAPALLSRLEAYFGVPHPYPKLDLIAVPEFTYGAMENAGLVTFRDNLLLLNPHQPAFEARRDLANVAAHEMAHMWFGNLVTIAWWDDLWLSESFADWICAKIVAQTNPEYRIEFAMLAGIHNAMVTDALPSVRAVRSRGQCGQGETCNERRWTWARILPGRSTLRVLALQR